MIKISLTGIKNIKVGDLANILSLMGAAIFGNPTVFTGTQPYTLLQIKALLETFHTDQLAFYTGGLLQRTAYFASRDAIFTCLLAYAPYVDGIAKGNLEILHLSTLPTTEDLIDYIALLQNGAIAEEIKATPGFQGQLLTSCKYFGPNANYLVIVSEDVPLPENVKISSSGQVVLPLGAMNNIIVMVSDERNKSIVGLTPRKLYFTHYVLNYGKYFGHISNGEKGTCGN